MPAANDVGPDLVVCGAARAGTSFLASLLGRHPAVDPGAVKEPNFYSREFGRSPEWYDALFEPRRRGLLRLDASMSYTYSHFPDALEKLAKHAPDAVVVYSVREPLRRLVSHYQLHRDYFRNEPARTLGEALSGSNVYSGASDYAHWLDALGELFPRDQVVIVPFDVVTGSTGELVDVVCAKLGIDPSLIEVEDAASQQHRNEVVEFRWWAVGRARRFLRRTGAYPWLRRRIGNDRLRRLRSRVTRRAQVEGVAEALDSCSRAQLLALDELYASARAAVASALEEQDRRLGLSWGAMWSASCPATGGSRVHQQLEDGP